jgi:predicted O-methyltransferase YrrM
MDDLPQLVGRAQELARDTGFPLTRAEAAAGQPSACLPGVGRFLAVLAAGCRRIGEMGTGTGVGTAWMASAMPDDCVLVTAELDEQRAAGAAALFAGNPRVEVLAGDALEALARRGPFDLLFADSGWRGGPEALLALVRPGGRIVMDDVTPVRALPEGSPYRAGDPKGGDPKREIFFGRPDLVSAEVVLPDLENSLLVGTRC